MSDKHELWGAIGATFYLTQDEAEVLTAFSNESKELFTRLVQDRRYEIDDQFYAPRFDFDKDIFIRLNSVGRADAVWDARSDKGQYDHKIWCRLGIVLPVDDQQLQVLERADSTAANLIFDLVEAGQYRVEGQCTFEDGLELEGYIAPETTWDVDLFLSPQADPDQQGGPTMVGP